MSAHSAVLERGFGYCTVCVGGWVGLRGWVLKGGVFFFRVCLLCLALPYCA